MNIVLFLGSGFSAPFGLPTMDQFLADIAISDRIEDPDREFIGKLVLDARRCNSFLESSAKNLEDILSFAVMGDRLGLHEEEIAPRVKQIIHRVYSAIKNQETYFSRLGNLSSFLGKSVTEIIEEYGKGSFNIITTNYDLVIETILLNTSISSTLPFDYEIVPGSERSKLYGNSGINLYKLHGSINWFKNDREIPIIDKSVKVIESVSVPYCAYKEYSYDREPLIIPPTFLKPDLPNALMKTWEGAARSIQAAEVVIFIGYSFPRSDIEMKYFFAKSLANNTKLQKIIICDIYAEDIVKMLKNDDSKFGTHFKDLLEPLQGNWIHLKLKIFGNKFEQLRIKSEPL